MFNAALATALLLVSAPAARGEERPAPPSSSLLAVSPDGRWVAASNPDSGTVTILDARTLTRSREIKVGRNPQGVAFTEDSKAIVSVNRGSGDVSWIDLESSSETLRIPVGPLPFGIVIVGDRAYVSLSAQGAVGIVELTARRFERTVSVESFPTGLAVAPARGNRPALLLVSHLLTGRLTALTLPDLKVLRVFSFGAEAGASEAVVISRDGTRAYLPETRSLSANPALTFDSTVLPVVEVVDLDSLTPLPAISFDNATMPAVNLPLAAAISPDGRFLYTANSGTDNVAVIDVRRGRELAHLAVGANPRAAAFSADGSRLFVSNVLDGTVSAIKVSDVVGKGAVFLDEMRSHPDPTAGYGRLGVRNLALLQDGTRIGPCANCHQTHDIPSRRGRVAVIRPGGKIYSVSSAEDDGREARTFVTSDGSFWKTSSPGFAALSPMPVAVARSTRLPLDRHILNGKKIFNAANRERLSSSGWISCASCHLDGGMDGRTWAGFPDGPRNTPALHDLAGTLPLHWSGDLDEIQDVEATIRRVQFGGGLTDGPLDDTLGPRYAGRSADLDDLAAYLETLKALPSPYASDASASEGGKLFSRLGCQGCHAPPLYTDLKRHDVGTGDSRKERNSHGRGTTFDTPSLLGVWYTGPYFHDGSAASLDDVFSSGGVHDLRGKADAAEVRLLADFLRTLPASDKP